VAAGLVSLRDATVSMRDALELHVESRFTQLGGPMTQTPSLHAVWLTAQPRPMHHTTFRGGGGTTTRCTVRAAASPKDIAWFGAGVVSPGRTQGTATCIFTVDPHTHTHTPAPLIPSENRT
jgi:hypothetical protein